MTPAGVADWVAAHPLAPAEVDCTVAVMLKILDGKCKMRPTEKRVMEWLYDSVRDCPGERLDADTHALIDEARRQPDESMRLCVYERRVLAETVISRPVMKAFKAMIRQKGLLDPGHDQEEAEA
ncbi:hypothetical protein [Stutzerimonas tarimensis]|uniref:Uncharacterized protein n=1 Tax=Stutzerimonas tarimensis TaxID=1507735 RepID=A0ABV7T527_9GAMM